MDAFEFIRSFLQHVLPSGFQKVRHFGFLHCQSKLQIEAVRWMVAIHDGRQYLLLVHVQLVTIPPPAVSCRLWRGDAPDRLHPAGPCPAIWKGCLMNAECSRRLLVFHANHGGETPPLCAAPRKAICETTAPRPMRHLTSPFSLGSSLKRRACLRSSPSEPENTPSLPARF